MRNAVDFEMLNLGSTAESCHGSFHLHLNDTSDMQNLRLRKGLPHLGSDRMQDSLGDD